MDKIVLPFWFALFEGYEHGNSKHNISESFNNTLEYHSEEEPIQEGYSVTAGSPSK